MNAIPSTVNMHIVGHCNYTCLYCYARFEKAQRVLPLSAAFTILRHLAAYGVRRVTFAGGEPTLHPELLAMLRECARLRLVTSLVTNGSRLDRDMCRRVFPWLRWLVLSVDSSERQTNDALGRRPRLDTVGQPVRVEQVAAAVHEWNGYRAPSDRVRLKMNIVVTSVNKHENPTVWLSGLRPERVKLLQCCIIPGENDDAQHLVCDPASFRLYAERVAHLVTEGVVVVAETSEDVLESYAMIDPFGRFRQSHADGYVESNPIQDVGLEAAWQQVGGCDLGRFRARGGEYDAGEACRATQPAIVAIEGLDGSGKTTVVKELAARLGAAIIRNPPEVMREERLVADRLPLKERREWYWMANREAMHQATKMVFEGKCVVMDRCFASTASYAAAEQGLIACSSDVPRDVSRPDSVFFLSLPEGERQRRLASRNTLRTEEENRLTQDAAFRARVIQGYAALGTEAIDASRTIQEIVQEIIRRMSQNP